MAVLTLIGLMGQYEHLPTTLSAEETKAYLSAPNEPFTHQRNNDQPWMEQGAKKSSVDRDHL